MGMTDKEKKKEAQREYHRKYRKANQEKIREYDRKRREAKQDYIKKYREEKREEAKKRYEANREELVQWQTKYNHSEAGTKSYLKSRMGFEPPPEFVATYHAMLEIKREIRKTS